MKVHIDSKDVFSGFALLCLLVDTRINDNCSQKCVEM